MSYALRSKGNGFLQRQEQIIDRDIRSREPRNYSTLKKIAIVAGVVLISAYVFNFAEHYNIGYEEGVKRADRYMDDLISTSFSHVTCRNGTLSIKKCFDLAKTFLIGNKN